VGITARAIRDAGLVPYRASTAARVPIGAPAAPAWPGIAFSERRLGGEGAKTGVEARELFNLGLVRALYYVVAIADLKPSTLWARSYFTLSVLD
jgi:hypothetical protein